MIRTQIQLTEEQARALKLQARREERSMADLLRASVSEHLTRRGVVDRTSSLATLANWDGRFRSGRPELADEHDRHLDEAFGS